MNSDKTSAERDALLKALKLADEGVTQARAAQQKAEARATQLSTELQAQRSQIGALKDGSQCHRPKSTANTTEVVAMCKWIRSDWKWRSPA
jgi:hypothetical protein